MKKGKKYLLVFVACFALTISLYGQGSSFKQFYAETTNPRPYTYGNISKSIGFGDFNEDGFEDVVAIGYFSFQQVEMGVRFGTCSGMLKDTLVIILDLSLAQIPAITVADITGDNHFDLVVCAGDKVAVYAGDGLGNFALPVYTAIPFYNLALYYKMMATGDLNHDGFDDMIATSLNSFAIGTSMSTYVAYGNANGTFTLSTVDYSILDAYVFYGPKSIADINQDGWDDVITSYGMVQYNQNGIIDSVPVAGLTIPPPYPIPLVYDQMVVQSDTDSALEIYFISDSALFFGEINPSNLSNSTKIQMTNLINSFCVGDFDSDGYKDDVVVELNNNTQRFYRGNGTSLVYEPNAKLSSLLGQVLACDINGDGMDDIYNSNNHNVNVCLGQFRFVNDNFIPLNGIPKYICHADIDQDGYDDIVSVSNSTSGALSIAYGNYCGLSEVKDYAGAVQFKEVKSGKFNADSLPDLMVSSNLYDSVYVYLNLGNRNFAPAVGYYIAHHLVQLSIADFNEDGIDDAFMLSTSPVVYNMIYGDVSGNGTFSNATITQSAATIGVYGADPEVADFNNDGHKDVSISHDNALGQRVTILFGDGAGNFPVKTPYSFGPSSVYCAPIHLNADSIVDMITSSGIGTQAIYFMCNNSNASSWSYNCISPLTFSSYSLTVADFNNDSIDDFVCNGSSFSVAKAYPCVLKPDYTTQELYLMLDEGSNKSVLADLSGSGFKDIAFYNSNSLVLYKNAMPGNPSIMLMNDTLFSSPQPSTSSPSIIEWYKDHVKIPNATQMYLPVTATGLYQLAYTYPDFSVVTSKYNVTTISSVGLEENGIETIRVFPNPAFNEITVSLSDGSLRYYMIMDALGKVKFSRVVNEKESTIISLKGMDAGLYFISFTDHHGNKITKKIVKL